MLIASLGVGHVAGCATGSPEQYQDHIVRDVRAADTEAFALGPGDVFQVHVYNEEELSGVYRVAPDGGIDFPLVGHVDVQGKTPSEVGEAIRAGLQDGYIRNPSVNVYVQEYNSKKVFVLGEVKKPGTFRFEESMNVVQVITLAGGFTDRAQKNNIVVTRVEGGIEKRIGVPVEDISEGRMPNFRLKPGDIVFVPESVL